MPQKMANADWKSAKLWRLLRPVAQKHARALTFRPERGGFSEEELRDGLGQRDGFLIYMGNLYVQVQSAAEDADFVEASLKVFPRYRSWERIGFSRTKYIRYHVECLLEQVYIFKERVARLTNWLARHPEWGFSPAWSKAAQATVASALKPLLQARRDHVHIVDYNDDLVSDLGLLDAAMEIGGLSSSQASVAAALESMTFLAKERYVRLCRETSRLLRATTTSLGDAIADTIARLSNHSPTERPQ
jgi:hypothetical protein